MRRECLTIIGTAHVSEESVNEVKDAIIVKHSLFTKTLFIN